MYELDKSDLITLIRGNSPSFDLMTQWPFCDCGTYNGSYGTWSWHNGELEKLTEEKLWDMHIEMKNQY